MTEERGIWHMAGALERLYGVLGGERYDAGCPTTASQEQGDERVLCLSKPFKMPDGAVLDRWGRRHAECPGPLKSEDLAETMHNVDRMMARIESIFRHYGNLGSCRSCGAAVYWVRTKNGKPSAYDLDAVTHWATCPTAQEHRKAKAKN